MLLTDILFHSATVAITVACSASLFAWLWFGVALRRLASGRTEW
jgi:HAMP domain-containing protein